VLIGTRYHDWAPTSEVVREAFAVAYQDYSPLTGTEHKQLR
jgi:homoserine kinase type II